MFTTHITCVKTDNTIQWSIGIAKANTIIHLSIDNYGDQVNNAEKLQMQEGTHSYGLTIFGLSFSTTWI